MRTTATIMTVVALAGCSGAPEPDFGAESACELLREMTAAGAEPGDVLSSADGSTWAAGINALAALSEVPGIEVHGRALEFALTQNDAETRVPVEMAALDEECSALGL